MPAKSSKSSSKKHAVKKNVKEVVLETPRIDKTADDSLSPQSVMETPIEKPVEQPVVQMHELPVRPTPPVHHESIDDIPSMENETPLDIEKILESDTEESDMVKKDRVWHMVGLFAAIGIVVVTVVVTIIYVRMPKANSLIVTEETDSVTPVPTTVLTPKTSEISIEVLNGTGIAGKASLVANALAQKGYVIAGIGNADKRYTETVINVKPSLTDAEKSLVTSDVSSLVSQEGIASVSSSSTTPVSDSTASAILILGK